MNSNVSHVRTVRYNSCKAPQSVMATYVPLSRPARLALTLVVVDQLDAVLRAKVETWLTRALVDVTLAACANETCRRRQNKRHTLFMP